LRPNPRLHRLPCIGGACVALAAPGAAAQGAFVPTVTVEGACPNQEAVQTVLRSLLPAADRAAASAGATIVDRGDSFVVVSGGRTKAYPDPDRNCAQRARIAAAFIALVLEPGPVPSESEPVAPPPAAPPRQEDRTPAPRRSAALPWVRLAVRGAFQVSSPLGLTSPGVAVDVAGGWGSFGGEAACAWIAGAEVPLVHGKTALLERVPCALGPVVRFFVGPRVETDLKVGLALGVLRAGGQGPAARYGGARLEAGARLAIDASLRLSPDAHFVPVAGVEVTYYPVPYDLVVAPTSVVASTPSVWAGATAGVCWNVL
jgi:hypothetical protein